MVAIASPRPYPFSSPSHSSPTQSLPEIKCQSCSRSIPMDDLGSHLCSRPGRSGFSAGREQPGQAGLRLDMSQLRPPEFSGQGEAGMAGVGRRAFASSSNSPTTPNTTIFNPAYRSHTPPQAAMATPPPAINVDSQNQSQPYFIASHANFNRPGSAGGTGVGASGAGSGQVQRHGEGKIGLGYRERQVSPYMPAGEWGNPNDPNNHNGAKNHNPPGRPPQSRTGIPIRLEVSPNPSSRYLPESKPSPPLVPQTATSSSSGSNSLGIPPATGSTKIGTGGTGMSGGGASYPRPGVTPSEYRNHQQQMQMQQGGTAPLNIVKRPSIASSGPAASTASTRPTGSISKGYKLEDTYAPGAKEKERKGSVEEAEKLVLRITNLSPEPEEEILDTSETNGSKKNEPMRLSIPSLPMSRTNSNSSCEKVESPSNESPLNSGSSGARLPFFERYKQMAERTNGATLMVRQISVREETKRASLEKTGTPVERSEPNKILDEENALVDSPLRMRLEDGNDQAGKSSLPWARLSGASSASLFRNRLEPNSESSHSGGSGSSIGSAQDRSRSDETAIITPSGSMNKLDKIAEGTESAYPTKPRTRGEEVEALTDELERDMDRLGEVLSPNISHRSGRESYQSDLVAPSDSISVPGYPDRNRPHDSFKAIRPAVKGRKDCQKCGMSLKGKRYVKRDGIMLCETDWKEMFLPKCRRCTLPIETSAISSSDGQLKGKWHRECFTCHDCQSPFSGDSFYVFEDRPYCQLHYHDRNGTLCASSECKQPIEGPCLLTPGNSRYHPGHLHCDHRDRYGRHSCRDKMEDYYEVSTMKVCERHKDEALRLMNRLAGTRDAAGRMSVAAKAEKRRTRMIVM